MVRFVDVNHIARWAAESDLEQILGELVGYLEEDFSRWEQFDLVPRIASHSSHGVVELMPTSDGESYSFKYVNGHPSNPARGYQTVTAFGMLADVHNGYPTFLSEMTLLTALRTAATSAMAAKALARSDSAVMALIGTGCQAEFQALAFRSVLGINQLRVWDIDPAAMDKFVRNVEPLGFKVVVADSSAHAVLGSDVITTCTADKANATVLTDAMVVPGVHVNAIGGDCPGKTELDVQILQRADVFVELPEQTRVEGEIQQMAPDFPVTELWRVVTGAEPGRVSAEQVTVFDSVGFAVEDFSALRYLRDRVLRTGHYQQLDLIADPADPKDLYSLVRTAAGSALVGKAAAR
ncbi:ornithine cyclodeaminase [Janibacter melonis]|uniref:ornithine cyclodeaminase n=1 Tax=Janibacter melonis TaxID=262209 RepID=UPI00174BE499|nr:ornithine cyclodeaminase [Janibacter melonis]